MRFIIRSISILVAFSGMGSPRRNDRSIGRVECLGFLADAHKMLIAETGVAVMIPIDADNLRDFLTALAIVGCVVAARWLFS